MAPQPSTTKPKPAAQQAETPKKPVQPHRLHGFGAFVAREILRKSEYRPDHSFEGFIAAIRTAITYCGDRDWNDVVALEEELEAQMCELLRAGPGDVSAQYVARHRKTQETRILFLTSWGFREAVEGQLSFNLHFRPDRPATKAKG